MISRSDGAFSATAGKLALPLGFRLQRRDQRKMDHIERGWDFLARNGWQAEAGLVIFCHGGLPRSTLCSENPEAAQKRNASNGYVSAGRKTKNEGKRSSRAKCSEEINRLFCSGGRLRYDHRVALRVNFS